MGKPLVHLQISKKLSTNAINNAMYEAGLVFVYKVAVPDLLAAAEAGKKAAEEGFANAKYDGVNDVRVGVEQSGPRTVELYAVGHALPYIEYGTGVFNKNNYDERGNVKEGKNYWFFSGKGRGDVQLTAGGEHAHYKRGGYVKERHFWVGPKGGKHYVGKNNPGIEQENGKDVWYEPHVAPVNSKKRATEPVTWSMHDIQTEVTKDVPLEIISKPNSYITHGNPPNNVMRHARNVMLRQFNAKYKSKYSTYEP